MSSRRGIRRRTRSFRKRSKRWRRVVRPGSGLGVVLDRAARHVAQHEALDRAVVEVQLRELGRAEVGLPAHRLVAVDRALRRPGRAPRSRGSGR